MMNDLERYPHAFVLACIADRQIKTEKAWIIPHRLRERIGSFSMDALARLNQEDWRDAMSSPYPLHRFVTGMPRQFHSAIGRIVSEYNSEASLIWKGKPSSLEVVSRFIQFDGVGPKIANMAANLLVRNFKIEFSDYSAIDVSVDVHVRRVFGRLGLCREDADPHDIIFKARLLSPSFPGLMDKACFDIGREWCGGNRPACERCYLSDVCPSSKAYRLS
jgi:endonuclease III